MRCSFVPVFMLGFFGATSILSAQADSNLSATISAVGFTKVNPKVYKYAFVDYQKEVGDINQAVLFNLGKTVLQIKDVEYGMSLKGLRPATLSEMIAFLTKRSGEVQGKELCALGSVNKTGVWWVPIADMRKGKELRLAPYPGIFGKDTFFLALPR